MRKELPDYARLDLSKKVRDEAHLLSEDMRREQQRLKWEEEEREAMQNPIQDIHYQNVMHEGMLTSSFKSLLNRTALSSTISFLIIILNVFQME